MSETTAPSTALPDKGLVARTIGVIMSPRETFEVIAAKPRWLGMLVVVTVLTSVLLGGFLATSVGQQAYIDKAQQGNPFGGTPSEQQMKATEKIASYMPYILGGGSLVIGPLFTALMAGIAFAIFGAFGGGQATYKQVFSVFTHAGVIGVLGQLVVTPVNYLRETMESPMNLAVFFPMLDAGSFLAKVLGSVELFRVWWVMVLAIVLAVIYRKKTRSVAIGLFALYAIIAVVAAAISAARS
jgi:hypothetical protein